MKPVFVTRFKHSHGVYHSASKSKGDHFNGLACEAQLLNILRKFYRIPEEAPSRIWIEWYSKPVKDSITVIGDPRDSYDIPGINHIGMIVSDSMTSYCSWGRWRVMPDSIANEYPTLHAKVYYSP